MTDKENLLKLIIKGESETLEFKESLKLLNQIGETISAFSNSKGGTIIVGISDKSKIIGISAGKNTLEELANGIKRNTDPKIYPSIKVGEPEDKRIVLVEVLENNEKPVFFKKHAYRRVGKTNLELTSSEIRKLAKETGEKVYWDEQVCKRATLKDIDEERVRWFLRKAEYERNFDIEPETPVEEALERLELMKNGKLTNAAILLFAKKPQKFFLQAETRCARFKGIKPVKPFLDMKVFDGSIFEHVDKALNFVLEHIPMRAYLVGKPEREERYEYPRDALREAIINAVCHRDYETSTNIQIRIFDDRIEVWGCGLLPEPLTPGDLRKKHRSVLRNHLIAKCFFLIKFIEQWGTGTNDMIHMCQNWGLPEPLFEYVTGDLVVTFRISRLTEEYLEKSGFNERQKKAIEYIKEHKKITSSNYANLFKITERMARNDLKELIDNKIVEKRGDSDKTTYYILAEI